MLSLSSPFPQCAQSWRNYIDTAFDYYDKLSPQTVTAMVYLSNKRICFNAASLEVITPLLNSLSHLQRTQSHSHATDEHDRLEVFCLQASPSLVNSLIDAWTDYAANYPQKADYLQIDNASIFAEWIVGIPLLSILDKASSRVLVWCADFQVLPYWYQGAPLAKILQIWFENLGYHFVHTAAVCHDDEAILLCGKGGSGKSTTTLACLLQGQTLLGEDFCLLNMDDDSARVYSLYNASKVSNQTLAFFPELLPHIVNPVRPTEDKALVFMDKHYPGQFALSAEVKAVVSLTIATVGVQQAQSRLTPLSKADAFKALAMSTIFQLRAGSQSFHQMVSLTKRVPCYQLSLGTDIESAPNLIRELFASFEK